MKLYYSKGACSLVVRIILNEIGASFDDEVVDLKAKTFNNGAGDFRKVNPKGAVPTLELDNGQILTENAIILQYLADTSKKESLLPKLGDFERYRVLEWLNFITTELHKGFTPLFNPKLAEDVKEQIFRPILKAKFTYINEQLKNHSYLCEDHFTLPDAYLYVMMRWAIFHKITLNDLPNLVSYAAKLNEHQSIKDALAQEELSAVTLK